MKKLLGWMMTGGLLLGYPSASKAQITFQPGRGGSPSVTFGQPAYGPQYAPSYGRPSYAQPGYTQPGYTQPGYGQYYQPRYAQPYQPNYVQPRYAQPYQPGTYSSGYSRYYTPGAGTNQVYSYPNSGYSGQYRQQPGSYNNGYSPNGQTYAPQGNGVIINGRSFTLPR